ncbi:MAG: hypothetical protein A3I61_19170 [Acidobacteria bacterium RIFCSPLOWO2_02_FULL_68_18]|nr:MAG: hypothetical protein A3I61_19170 [Acidobacteria bacterium RIFCSPLOWO2_02_FULL_68_18]
MKRAGGFAAAAVALAALGALAVAAGVVEHRVARAEEALATLDYVETERAYDELERYVAYARYLPWSGGDTFMRLRAHRAAVAYWRGDYDALSALGRAEEDGTDAEVLFLAANATYRLAQKGAFDRQALLRALDEARGAYQTVLRDTAAHADAAFNYEYLGRVRDLVAKAAGRPGGANPLADAGRRTLHGREGAPPPGRPDDDFKIFVPEEPEERGRGSDPGSDQLRRRRG